jgi:hypothetical protein
VASYQIPLDLQNGLPYLKFCPATNEEVTSVTHVFKTSDIDWDPKTYNNDVTDIIEFYNASIDTVHCSNFDDNENYRHCTMTTHTLHEEPGVFNVHEYPDYLDAADDILDAYNPDLVNQIYEFQAFEAS